MDKALLQETTSANSFVYDLVVIGSGPAGHMGSIRGAPLGMKVASIEKRKRLRGTCLSIGRLPVRDLFGATDGLSLNGMALP
ncbi:MAG: hypothetical protein K2X47_09495 [Bdellovibrionales bacterium]|nr:hypothetical protein [Bdellovibrionales bacterium]